MVSLGDNLTLFAMSVTDHHRHASHQHSHDHMPFPRQAQVSDEFPEQGVQRKIPLCLGPESDALHPLLPGQDQCPEHMIGRGDQNDLRLSFAHQLP